MQPKVCAQTAKCPLASLAQGQAVSSTTILWLAPAPGTQHQHQQPVCTRTGARRPAPATCLHRVHSQLTAPAPGARHPAPALAPATCLHHVRSQLTAPALTPAPSTSNLFRKRARATHCYLKQEPHSFAIWGKTVTVSIPEDQAIGLLIVLSIFLSKPVHLHSLPEALSFIAGKVPLTRPLFYRRAVSRQPRCASRAGGHRGWEV